jgi:hypothetical protein
MKMKSVLLAIAFLLFNTVFTHACGGTPQMYAQWVLSTNAALATNAMTMLRGFGKEGLQALLSAHEQLIAKHNANDPQWQRLRVALDVVGAQRDCSASRLFWHTNFNDAKAEAQRSGKPILSLRLLGRLDEELSCANSRFFRTTLYANKEVSDYLRDHFVLHWQSVRPVPRITIDMGDGRKIERTITGNSIHYVLGTNGEVLDALPGLYGPRAFLEKLERAESLFGSLRFQHGSAHDQYIAEFHLQELRAVTQRWQNDLGRINATTAISHPATMNGISAAPANGTRISNAIMSIVFPNAAAAMPLTASKADVELPMLRALVPRRAELERSMNDETWAKIAALHPEDGSLDANSVALIRAKTMNAKDAMRLALSKSRVEDPMLKMIQNLQRSISEDTVRNEYTFHAKIHEWLAAAGTSREVDSLNRRVYTELFLTPDTDPWLGLAPTDTFSALENSGLAQH